MKRQLLRSDEILSETEIELARANLEIQSLYDNFMKIQEGYIKSNQNLRFEKLPLSLIRDTLLKATKDKKVEKNSHTPPKFITSRARSLDNKDQEEIQKLNTLFDSILPKKKIDRKHSHKETKQKEKGKMFYECMFEESLKKHYMKAFS